jgi:hypothetical protein
MTALRGLLSRKSWFNDEEEDLYYFDCTKV